MDLKEKNYDYDNLKKQGTGSHERVDDYKIILYPFDKYQIKIKLSPSNEFIGIVEVKINKEFLSHKQKITSQGFLDVEEFYRE
jgi:predicted component of type VI protein secretion system